MIRIEDIRHMEKSGEAKRYLIDREWPKDVIRAIPHKEKSGQTRAALAKIHWSPELAPSAALWKWFHHDPEKTELFRSRFFRELAGKKKHWTVIARASEEGEVVLLYHGKQGDASPAHFLKEFLDAQSKARKIPAPDRKIAVGTQGQGIAPPVDKAISHRYRLPLKPEAASTAKSKTVRMPDGKRKLLRQARVV